jgi:hypothetical protein
MKRIYFACLFLCLTTTFLLPQSNPVPLSDAGSGSVPSEPGMYVQTAGGFNKILGQIVAFKRSGSLLVSKLTVGIKTRKENVQLLGPHAQTIVDGKPVFYFIPPRQEADAGVNAGDLVLVRLEEKAERRQFEIGAQGVARTSLGISITHQIQLFRSEPKPGIYTITPAVALGKGEYALYLARGEGMQEYVYDFSVSSPLPSRQADKVETVSAVQSPLTTAPAGVTASVPKTGNRGGSLRDAGTNASNPSHSTDEATAEISSDPLGADIEIDGNFVGNTPSSMGIVAGEHTLRISKNGYKKWERTLISSTGKIKIAAVLEPIPVDAGGTAHTSAEVAATSTIRDPAPPANSSEGMAEEARIGIWLTGNPTVKHDGIEISGVQPGGPADKIDIKPGDVIIAIDGHYLYTIDDLRAVLLRHERGARLAIRYRHDRLTYDNYLALTSKDAAPRR